MPGFSEDEDDEEGDTEDLNEPWDFIEVPEGAIAFPEDLPWGGDPFRHIMFLPPLEEALL